MPLLVTCVGTQLLRVAQRRHRPLVVVLRLNFLEQARHGLDVVIENLRRSIRHHLQRIDVALEIGNQHFDGAAGLHFADALNHHRKDRRAAILALVAIDRRDHRMAQIHRLDGLRHPIGFIPIHRRGAARLDVAERARARAHIAHHQERRRAAPPAFADVGAQRFFADGMQRLHAHQALEFIVGLALRRADLQPLRPALGFLNSLNLFT